MLSGRRGGPRGHDVQNANGPAGSVWPPVGAVVAVRERLGHRTTDAPADPAERGDGGVGPAGQLQTVSLSSAADSVSRLPSRVT